MFSLLCIFLKSMNMKYRSFLCSKLNKLKSDISQGSEFPLT